jgi:hypothetical protein
MTHGHVCSIDFADFHPDDIRYDQDRPLHFYRIADQWYSTSASSAPVPDELTEEIRWSDAARAEIAEYWAEDAYLMWCDAPCSLPCARRTLGPGGIRVRCDDCPEPPLLYRPARFSVTGEPLAR